MDILYGLFTGLCLSLPILCVAGLIWLRARTRADSGRSIHKMWLYWGRRDTHDVDV